MSSAAATFIAGPSSAAPHLRKSKKGVSFCHYRTHFIRGGALKSPNQISLLLIRKPSNGLRRNPNFNHSRPFSPVMEWQECRAEIEIDIPASLAYECYSDREQIPQWMPFISSVKVLEDNRSLSRWSLKYEAFGRNIEFSWLARNMQPIRNQKIHWRSLEGLPNKGAVRFFPKGPSSCRVELTTSYEVPEILTPVATALKPFTEGLLYRGLEKFAMFAKNYKKGAPRS
ncbi:uncharacterized protein A4U43_C02F22460 [Asparagus officinalis]|uniref:Coenzyme Q-binding protein COQ10 START domain-containing protein n=1 Tax=Asparagus officinalis TaxID=4686 RepID=A0A5P1FQ53_ASPOF|nr:uncharacterized protein LOC109831925 [Asparagus officinalis]ONK78790.1 uncharacterized protein A4U43_C02F22460 [Asparagus officinalis]